MSPLSKASRIAFVVLCVLQLGAAASGIARYERTLSQGDEVLFEVAPVDPADPFRGRYVQLGFALSQATHPMRGALPTQWYEPGYAVLRVGPDKIAAVEYVTSQRPSSGLFISVTIDWPDENKRIHITPPFDRYYMEESLAPAAERAYREASANARVSKNGKSYAIVRILDGTAVIEGVILDGEPIEKAARKAPAQ